MDNLGYLFAAYTVVWVILSSYTWHIGRCQHKLEEDCKRLETQLNSVANE